MRQTLSSLDFGRLNTSEMTCDVANIVGLSCLIEDLAP